jgi:Zn-finger nucleic acid-binding protein
VCPDCNGLWVPGRKIEVLIARAIEAREQLDQADEPAAPRVKGANPVAQRVQYRKCPVCEAFMLRRNFRKTSGIIIDRCHEHGTWLDADELEEIAGFLLSGGRPGAEEAMRQQAKNDAKQRAALGTYDHQVRPRVESEVVSGKKGMNLLNLLYELLR